MENCERKTCQVRMMYNKPCARPVYDGEKCICHSGKNDKDAEFFQRELDKIFTDNESQRFELIGFIFPKDGYQLPKEYERDVYFLQARFLGKANFQSVKFLGRAIFLGTDFLDFVAFDRAKFLGETDFRHAEFLSGVTFRRTHFSGRTEFTDMKVSFGANFTAAEFSGTAYFYTTQFLGEADFRHAIFSGKTYFYSTVFKGLAFFSDCRTPEGSKIIFGSQYSDRVKLFSDYADFSNFTFGNANQVVFRKVLLRNCSFLETDVSEVQFIDVEWPSKGRLFKRKSVYDERRSNQYELIAQLYRRLQANYITNYRFPEAGDFYIGEQEMMRKAKGKIGQFLSTNFLYLLISRYGESFTLPFLWLLLTLFAFPGLLLYGGVNLDYDSQTTGFVETVNYDWTWSPKDLLPLKNDYWRAFAVNISFVTFHRSEIGEYLPEIGQRVIVNLQILLVIALAAFFLLALRRKFKRKSF